MSVTSNPWETHPTFINVGGLNKILAVNKRYAQPESLGKVLTSNHSSIEFIDVLQQLSQLNQEQTTINVELQSKKIYKEFFNVLHCDVLDGLISMVDFLSKHLQNIIDHKGQLVDHLHKPFVGQYLPVDSQYHNVLCEFFPSISKNLADLSSILNNIEWIHKYSIQNSNIATTLNQILSTLSLLQSEYQAMTETRDLMESLMKQKTDGSH